MKEGRIIKALSGFYYVQSDDEVYQCRGRGVFRKRNVTPLVGDFVTFTSDHPDEGYVTKIKPRTNELTRPPIANIDQAIIVCSVAEPDFNALLLDQFLVLIESKNIQPLIFISKADKGTDSFAIEKYMNIYRKIGYAVELFSSKDEGDLSYLKKYFAGNVSVIAGQSGVGKSSLLNHLEPDLYLKTGDVSVKLGRGKHTTRHVELMNVYGGLVADTPGFSSLDFRNLLSEEVASCFPEIDALGNDCKFRGCMHYKEPNCAVKQAVESGEIATSRYEHYVRFYEECKNRKPRY